MTTASTSRDAIRIGILLTSLFAVAAVAVRVTISVIEDIPGAKPETTAILTFSILAITTAFMCIAGAAGVYSIRYSVAKESRRRVGRFVDELAPIHDGIMTVDNQGRVIGSNPALRKLTSIPIKGSEPIQSLFTCLSDEDVSLLLDPDDIREIERVCQLTEPMRALRFRSQPAEDMHVFFVSDITNRRAEEHRREQIARFQLVGRIARGVAYDFNNLLCGISAHGSLLRRLKPGSEDIAKSSAFITREAERGISLSRHLLDLSHSGMAGQPTDRLDHFAGRATELLKIGLSSAWTVSMEADASFAPIALSGVQIEQIILNLGMLAADTLSQPGSIQVTVKKPGQDHLLKTNGRYAAILLLSASTGLQIPDKQPPPPSSSRSEPESGIILSVVRAMVEECGGILECISYTPEQVLFRVLLPHATIAPAGESESELQVFLAGLHMLLAGRKEVTSRITTVIGKPEQAVICEINDAVGLLVKAETDTTLDVILIDQRLIGHEPDAFLRALMKLRPQAGIVLVRDEESIEPLQCRGVIVLPATPTAAELAGAVIEAKGLAHRSR
jgi:nitrogen-specific signal transduction histidine kinase